MALKTDIINIYKK